MQINKLELKNFKQYKETVLEFPSGLTGFVGKNGSGKSTIFEAIANAFYGKFETNKDLVKNDKVSPKENMSVVLHFEDKGDEYKIVRDYRGKNLNAKADLFKNGNHLVTGAEEVNRELRKILKIDYSNFKNSFFARQKEVTSLLELGTTERQRALRKMLGLEKLDKLETKIKEEIKEQTTEIKAKKDELLPESEVNKMKKQENKMTKELSAKKKELQKINASVNKAKKDYSAIKSVLSELEQQKTKHDSLSNDLEIVKTNTGNTSENIEKAENELKELRNAVKKYKSLLPKKEKYEKLEKEIELLQKEELKLKDKINNEKRIEKNNEQIENEKHNISGWQTNLKSFEGLEESLEEIKTKRKKLKADINGLKKHLTTANKLTGTLQNNLNEKSDHLKEIKKLGKNSNCPTCERPLKDHYDFLVKKYTKEISELKEKLIDAKSEEKKLKELIDKHENGLEKLNSEELKTGKKRERKQSLLEKIDESKKRIKEYRKQNRALQAEIKKLGIIKFNKDELVKKKNLKKQLEPDYKLCISLSKKKDEVPLKMEEITKLKNRLKSLQTEEKKLKEEIAGLNFDEKKYIVTKKEREKKESILNEWKEKLSEKKEEIAEINSALAQIQTKLSANEKLKKKIEKLEKEVELFNKLATTVKMIKEKITSKELPKISAGASELFTKITRGRYFNLKIDEGFNFKVTRDDKEVELTTLSGGEKDLAALCLRIAISKRISNLAGRSNMGFLALDEVFGSQDEDRREELLNALHVISEHFRQIFVVSHNRDVQDEFPTTIIVSKKGDFSRAELVMN